MESGKHGIPSTRIMLRKSGELTSSRYLLYRLEFCMFWSSFIMGQGRIVHTAVTDSPNQFWLTQQFRIATPYDRAPKYIVHDNDPVFKSRNFKKLLDDSGVTAITTGREAPWQNPYAKRAIGTIRRELLDYVVPLNERHLDRLLKEYVNAYYNPHRTHQGLGGATPIPHRHYPPTDAAETTLRKTRILGGLYHTLENVG